MSQDDDYISHARELWRDAKREHPVATTVAEILPVTGQIAAVADYADAMHDNDTMGGIKAALSFIPGVKLGKAASKIAPAAVRYGMTAAEKLLHPIVRAGPRINRAMNADEVVEAADDYAQSWNQHD